MWLLAAVMSPTLECKISGHMHNDNKIHALLIKFVEIIIWKIALGCPLLLKSVNLPLYLYLQNVSIITIENVQKFVLKIPVRLIFLYAMLYYNKQLFPPSIHVSHTTL